MQKEENWEGESRKKADCGGAPRETGRQRVASTERAKGQVPSSGGEWSEIIGEGRIGQGSDLSNPGP